MKSAREYIFLLRQHFIKLHIIETDLFTDFASLEMTFSREKISINEPQQPFLTFQDLFLFSSNTLSRKRTGRFGMFSLNYEEIVTF